jgi:hypothetical protein
MSTQNNSNVGMWIAIGLGGFVLLIVLALPILGFLFFWVRSTPMMVRSTSVPSVTAVAQTASHESSITHVEGDQPAIVIESQQQFEQLQEDLLELGSIEEVEQRIGSVSYEQTTDRVTMFDPSGANPQIIETIHRAYDVRGADTGRLTVDVGEEGVTAVSFLNMSP